MMRVETVRRIVCIGNRLVDEDAVGPAVFDCLRPRARPAPGEREALGCVEVIDGGLRGLDLLPLFENAQRVVLVDTVRGFGGPGEIVILRGAELAGLPESPYDHGGGLTYLLKVLPQLVAPLPEIVCVGVEPPADSEAIERAAATAVAACSAPAVAVTTMGPAA